MNFRNIFEDFCAANKYTFFLFNFFKINYLHIIVTLNIFAMSSMQNILLTRF